MEEGAKAKMAPKNGINKHESDADSDFSSVSHDSMPAIEAYGHKYHGSGRIWVPIDESAVRHAVIQHDLFKLILNDRLTETRLPIEDPNYKAPNGQPFSILDVGSGTGTWAVEMARTFPQAEVLGIDITSALLPTDVPKNLTFEIADAEEHLPPKLFDFIHMRNLVGGGIRDWEGLMGRVLKHLKPGGQLEYTDWRPLFFDHDDSGEDAAGTASIDDPQAREYVNALKGSAVKEGVDLDPVLKTASWLGVYNEVAVARKTAHFVPLQSRAGGSSERQKAELANAMLEYCKLVITVTDDLAG